ncbi:MAG TPA: S41 family peptidase [Pirellulaceae bacterium]|jgi:carboxyl-terminal processing protease|nr:S41 family peptidase [Pirellulaceae bacterium]
MTPIAPKLCLTLAAAAASLFAFADVRGQDPLPTGSLTIPADALPGGLGVAEALNRGRELESTGRWVDALKLYEEAAREYPQEGSLSDRVVYVRVQLDLDKRLADRSFHEQIVAANESSAVAVVNEAFNKIEYFHVDQPNWTQIVRRGGLFVEASLDKTSFRERYMANVAPAAEAAFRKEFRETIDRAEPRSVSDAVRWAEYGGRLAWHRMRVPPQAVILQFACAAANALDEYSTYLTPGQMREMSNQINGELVGLGIELRIEDKSLFVVHIIPGGPAARGGMVAGERIVGIEGQPVETIGAENAADSLRGEEGSFVRVALQNAAGERRELSFRRERIDVPSVENVRIVDSATGVGYFRINSFQRNTTKEADAALYDLHRQGMRSLIIDLRGNPGGLLDAAIELGDRFLESGVIVSTRGRLTDEDHDYAAQAQGTWRVPLVVLVDGDSASASEIFAGAIRDQQRGVIVGEKTYGKGTVQGIFDLPMSGAGIKLTTSKFFSPSGRAIAKAGVEPHVAVQRMARPAIEDDAAILAARHVLNPASDPVLSAGMQEAVRLLPAR